MGKQIATDESLKKIEESAEEQNLEEENLNEEEESQHLEDEESNSEDESNSDEEEEDESNSDDENDDDENDDENDDEDEEEDDLPELPEWAEAYRSEFEEKGDLSDESIQKIVEEHKIPERFVRDYVNLAKSNREVAKAQETSKFNSAVYDAAGGKESYDKMIEFASENYSEKEAAKFDKAIDSGDPEKAELAVAALKARYEATQSAEESKSNRRKKNRPRSLRGNAGANSGSSAKPFKSQAEVLEAMNDERYGTDHSYVKQVEARLAATDDSKLT